MVPGSSLLTWVADVLLAGGEYGGVGVPAVVRAAQPTHATRPATVNACETFDMMFPFYSRPGARSLPGLALLLTVVGSHITRCLKHDIDQRITRHGRACTDALIEATSA